MGGFTARFTKQYYDFSASSNAFASRKSTLPPKIAKKRSDRVTKTLPHIYGKFMTSEAGHSNFVGDQCWLHSCKSTRINCISKKGENVNRFKNVSNYLKTRRISFMAAAIVALALFSTVSRASSEAKQAFGFNASLISGFPGNRQAEITGGGAFNLPANFVQSGGGFRCLTNIAAGPFSGCQAGQGVRWDTAALLPSTGFQCTGADVVKNANTGNTTVVLAADFYRQGDGNEESFTAKMIVSESDLAPEIDGIQNVWIQGIGCGSAIVSFN
jgi:hypothetical protein